VKQSAEFPAPRLYGLQMIDPNNDGLLDIAVSSSIGLQRFFLRLSSHFTPASCLPHVQFVLWSTEHKSLVLRLDPSVRSHSPQNSNRLGASTSATYRQELTLPFVSIAVELRTSPRHKPPLLRSSNRSGRTSSRMTDARRPATAATVPL